MCWGKKLGPKNTTVVTLMTEHSPYITIAASLADPTTHWDAVSELWVAVLLAAPYGNTAPAIVSNLTTV